MLWLDTFLAWSLGAQLLECEGRLSCHLKTIPCQKLELDLTSPCKMELISEVSVRMAMDSSAMVIFNLIIFLSFLLHELLTPDSYITSLIYVSSQWASLGYLWSGGFGQVTYQHYVWGAIPNYQLKNICV